MNKVQYAIRMAIDAPAVADMLPVDEIEAEPLVMDQIHTCARALGVDDLHTLLAEIVRRGHEAVGMRDSAKGKSDHLYNMMSNRVQALKSAYRIVKARI